MAAIIASVAMGAKGAMVATAAPLLGDGAIAEESAGYPDPARLEEEVRALETDEFAQRPPDGAIVCVGSSSLRMWHPTMQADLAPFVVVPRGYGGSTMFDVWTHLDRLVLPLRPAAILLYEGDNDIDFGVSAETVRATFDSLRAGLHRELPECRIFVLSIKPSPARWHEWPEATRANALLASACAASDRLHFVDVAAPMLDGNGSPREDLFLSDRLHLNERGYAVWREVVLDAFHRHAPELAVRRPHRDWLHDWRRPPGRTPRSP